MKMRPFDLALAIFFAALGALALFLMATYEGEKEIETEILDAVGTVDIWGTLPSDIVGNLFRDLSKEQPIFSKITYSYVSQNQFDNTLRDALADGGGPDLILVSHEELVNLRNRIQPISYEVFPAVDVRSIYIDGAQIFALKDGMYGYPLAVDPLMMYWNKDVLTTNEFLTPPKTWEVMINTMFPELIERDFDRTIKHSVVAMGEYGNVRSSFGVISALILQSGSKGVRDTGNGYSVELTLSETGSDNPLRATADFYTRFSKPSNSLYSWNRSLPEDRQRFTSGDLSFYFGYGSEGREIERINPNLNFDIAEIPQGEGATVRRTYGKFYALSLLKASDNASGAAVVMQTISNPAVADQIAIRSNMVPAFRSSVSSGSNDTYGRITYKSAAVAFGWLNPDINKTNDIFKTMVEDINENRQTVDGATSDLVGRLKGEY